MSLDQLWSTHIWCSQVFFVILSHLKYVLKKNKKNIGIIKNPNSKFEKFNNVYDNLFLWENKYVCICITIYVYIEEIIVTTGLLP